MRQSEFREQSSGVMSRRMLRLIGLSLLLCGGLLAFFCFPTAPDPERQLQRSRIEMASRNLPVAESLAREVAHSNSPSAPWGAIVAAEAAIKQNAHHRALVYYQMVPPGPDEAALSAQFGAAEMFAHAGRLSESEGALRKLLEYAPDHVLAHYRLAFILNITGRRWEAGSHLLFLLKSDAAELDHLLTLGNTERAIEDRGLLGESLKNAPDDPLPLLGGARIELTLSHSEKARSLLMQVRQKLPKEPEAAVRWGQILLEGGKRDVFLAWNAALNSTIEAHPEIWLLRGLFWQKEKQPRWAVRCFWEALRRDPELRHANYQLGQSLSRLGDPRAAKFLERSDQQLGLTLVLDDIFHTRTHLASMRRAAEMTEQMGRLWESRGWAMMVLKSQADTRWAAEMLQRVQQQLQPDTPQTVPTRNLSRTTDLSEFPLPIWPESQTGPLDLESPTLDANVHFRDDSHLLDGSFTYFQSPDSSTPGARIFETTGGGVGVLDYDNDQWPDLYFTQGSVYPEALDASRSQIPNYRDEFRRNHDGQGFQNVTELAHLGDEHYSQGLAVGDFNNDGFQDLYVANIGLNRLYENQGDGTFREVTSDTKLTGDFWTTSCMIADLNGDGLPDIYDVNYCAVERIATLMCEKLGLMRSCSPRAFDPAPDQIWLNMGDGQFRDATAESGIDLPNGYGLGIVAANFADNGRLSLFVANDEVPNFFFVNRTDQDARTLKFEELGLPSGLSVDGEGASQACMGVAAGDANGDGTLDLFVTNFYRESNTLYLQTGSLQFLDDTKRARLREPSFEMLGFGTQFLDADLDGHLDLVVANGHIDDMTSVGEPYHMPPQVFRNQGNAVFREVPAVQLGPLFARKYLGRGLARIDWNRDGREDFCVSNIGDTAVLATNDSRAKGHFIALRLIGTSGERDAFGAQVEVQAGAEKVVRELVAGNGYHASNERVLVFGVPATESVDSVKIKWLQGAQQDFRQVPVDREFLIIEGHDKLWPCPR